MNLNKDRIISEQIERNRIIRDTNRTKLLEYLSSHPCVDCGESDPVVLEFDHKEGVEKYLNISIMMRNRSTWNTILREIEKCEIRCANCHRRKTSKEQGWSKGNFVGVNHIRQ